ncbi:hypothetical protein E2C01_023612 [Portunus trituberculatus]|uniref:Uncharacterized protein n=1 Tax=Portunus trituberculatus TaxID=210409 RepID=A0A5B7E8G2_PORTR|nr:hypothetical protein [Portunus trituberculatus]
MTEDRRTKGHVKKIRMRQCVKDFGKYSFPHRNVCYTLYKYSFHIRKLLQEIPPVFMVLS